MGSNSHHTIEELERYILLYLEEGVSYQALCNSYGLLLNDASFFDKALRYQTYGLSGIQKQLAPNYYSKAFKLRVIREFLEEGTPLRQLARDYNIPSHATVRSWVIKYTKGEEIRSTTPLPEVYRMKKSQEEKIEIVQACLASGLSYKKTAEKYQESYSNVYAWVQKYKKYGPDGLVDGRGRGKPSTIQTTEEKLKTEMAALKARNEYLETENAALKKLNEIERELMSRKRGMKRSTKRLKSYKRKDSK